MREQNRLKENSEANRLIPLVICLFVTFIGIAVRLPFLGFVSDDGWDYLIPWYEEILANGGLKGIGTTVGNYNLAYQFLIACFTLFPISPITAYKILSIIFDYTLGLSTGYLVYTITSSKLKASIAYAAIVFSPVVIMDSAVWAQCDSIYITFAILALTFALKEKYPLMCICLGMALAFKLQIFFLFPFVGFLYMFKFKAKKNKFHLYYLLLIPLMLFVSAIPHVIAGGSFMNAITFYTAQTDESYLLYENYPGFWAIFLNGYVFSLGDIAGFYKIQIALFTILTVGLTGCYLCRKKTLTSKEDLLRLALILTFTTIFFLPCMHDRYAYFYETIALVYCFINKKSLPLYLGLRLTSYFTYLYYLIGLDILPLTVLAIATFAILIAYFFMINSEINGEKPYIISVLTRYFAGDKK
ncbi:MAG: hypothetical protein K5745_08325 [Saccharofermentans sp.]|nr:hypothetical protein [Saccharofermentans sp.]